MTRLLRTRIGNIRLLTWLKVAFAGVLLLVALNSNFLSTVRREFQIGYLWAALAVQPIIILAYAALSMRHVALIGTPRVPLFKAFKAMVLAQGLNLVLPARLSELIKGTYLRDHAEVPLSVGMSAVLLERTIDLIIIACLGSLGLILFATAVDYRVVLVFGLIGGFILLVAFHARKFMVRLARAIPWPRVAEFAERAYLHLHETVRTAAFLRALGWGVTGWVISYVGIFLFMHIAASQPLSLSGALLLIVFTTVGAAVPLLPGGIGTYEAAGVVVLRSFGYEFSEALALVVAMHAAQLAMPVALSWVVLLTERVGLASLIADLRDVTKRREE